MSENNQAATGTPTVQEVDEIVVHAHDYFPGESFDVVASLETAAEQDLMEEAYEDEFDDPDDWDAYVINYELGGDAGRTGIILVENGDIDVGDDAEFDDAASFRNATLNLIETDAD